MPAKNHTSKTGNKKALRTQIIAIGTLCVTASFALGIQSAGDVETVMPLQASTAQTVGDVTGDGVADARDAAMILEIALGYRDAEPAQLKADPDGDGELTVEDALLILHASDF